MDYNEHLVTIEKRLALVEKAADLLSSLGPIGEDDCDWLRGLVRASFLLLSPVHKDPHSPGGVMYEGLSR